MSTSLGKIQYPVNLLRREAALNSPVGVLPRRLLKLLRNQHRRQRHIQRNILEHVPAELRRQHPTDEARHDENARERRLDGISYFTFPNVSAVEWA